MIKIENVTYRYKKGNDILKKINLEIQDKETVVIMGKNGSRKINFRKVNIWYGKTKRRNNKN